MPTLPLDLERVPAASSPGSTIRAMAGALAELSELLSHQPDRAWALDIARDLQALADQLPPRDGGHEVRHG